MVVAEQQMKFVIDQPKVLKNDFLFDDFIFNLIFSHYIH